VSNRFLDPHNGAEITGVQPAEEFDWEHAHAEATEQEFERRITRNAIPACELIHAPKLVADEYIENLSIAGGLTILAGDPKVGKSTLLYHALGCLASDEPFLGAKCTNVSVLYQSELSANILQAQIEKVPGLTAARKVYFIPAENCAKITFDYDSHGERQVYREPYVVWGEQLKFWADQLRETGAKIFVLDTLMTFIGLEAGGLNDPAAVAGRVASLKRALLGVNSKISILILHHLRKGDGNREKGAIDMAGSYALRASSDINVSLISGGNATYLRGLKVESRLRTVEERQIVLMNNEYVAYGKGDNTTLQEYLAAHPEDAGLDRWPLMKKSGCSAWAARAYIKERDEKSEVPKQSDGE